MTHFTTVVDELKRYAREDPDHVLYTFIDFDESAGRWVREDHTAGETYDQALAMAYMLRRRRVRPGERAVIFSMQDYGTICAVYGCMMAGVVFTLIPPPIDEEKADRFLSVLTSCHPRALISNAALEKDSDVHLTGRLLREAPRDTLRLARLYTDRLIPYRRADVIRPARPEDLVYLQYTSGSTSAPKGARVRWRNLMKNVEQCMGCMSFDGVSLATWVPFFHNLGLVITICLPPLSRGSTAYYFPTTHFLENPKLWFRLISDFEITLTVGPGSAYDAMSRIVSPEEAERLSLGQVTHFMNGSEYISAANVAAFSERFGTNPNAMAPGYGVAENCCLATFANRDYHTLRLEGPAYREGRVVTTRKKSGDIKEIVSVGRPVQDLTVVIGRAKTGEVYPEGRIGEIFLSGASVVDGYWGAHPENKNFHIKMQGYRQPFYRTGDIGFFYKKNLYITGRAKEMMVVNGSNLYPSDLAQAVERGVPALAGAAIAFFSCEIGEREQPVAVVEARPTERFDRRTAEINAVISDRFGFSFYDIVFVPRDTLPRTDNRKLQMLKARAQYEAGELHALYSSHVYRVQKKKSLIGRSVDAADELLDKSVESAEHIADRADEVFEQVRVAFANTLHIENFSPSESFLALGGDSLMGFELIQRMEQRFHIHLDLRELLRDSSVLGITKYIYSVLGDARGAHREKALDLRAECRLDEDITFDAAYDTAPADCRVIFLTGATGFLGAHLVRAIWRDYPHDGLTIYCLVRARDEAEGMARIRDNMAHYQCWHDTMEPYIHPVVGDISQPRLGLSDDIWQRLADEAQVIYHNAALLNFIYPYEYLKLTNVDGTAETLRLAGEGRAKYYHYVSSYSVHDTPGHESNVRMEDEPLTHAQGFSLAYSETKWVSEQLVGIARRRGLRAAIYRPGDITGAANGIWDVNDMISRMLVSTIQMRAIPLAAYRFHMTPVDYVARALVHISRKKECFGHAFHLVNPRDQGFATVISFIRGCGYTVRYIPFRVWRNRLRKADTSQNALALLESLFEQGDERYPSFVSHFIGLDPVYDTSNTRLLLSDSSIRCHPVDQRMMQAYLDYFKSQGYIP